MTVKGSVFRLFAGREGRRLTKRKFPVKETSVSLLRKLRFLTKEILVSRQGNNGFSL